MKLQILNGAFDVISLDETVEWARAWLRSGRRGWITTVNVSILMAMRGSQWLQRFVEDSALTVADGVPLVWVSRLSGVALPERVAGVELVERLADMAREDGVPVYLLGARGPIVERVRQALVTRYPGLNVCGSADGYFGDDEAPARARAVRDSGATLLIVGMGVPRQERFIREQWDLLGVRLAVPVGGSFDVIAGDKRRAPEFVQNLGFEWLYRLAQEPLRLGKRYAVTNTQFVLLMLRDVVFRKSPSVIESTPPHPSGQRDSAVHAP